MRNANEARPQTRPQVTIKDKHESVQPEGVKGASADFVCFHCPLVAPAGAKPSATCKIKTHKTKPAAITTVQIHLEKSRKFCYHHDNSKRKGSTVYERKHLLEVEDDDAFCEARYQSYLNDPDKGDTMPLEEVARSLGMTLNYPLVAGAQMRALYEQGKIKNESEFQEELAHVLRCCEECQ